MSSATTETKGEIRVKDFTYYPLMSDNQCAFRLLTSVKKQTYRQCQRAVRVGLHGYGFCHHHAEYIRTTIANADKG